MRYIALTFLSVLCLSACAPLTIYHREGVAVTRMQSDLLECQVEALSEAPVATQLRRGPPRYVPSYRYCYHGRDCYWRGGYFYPGEVYSVDVNASLRQKLEVRCMANEGYRRVEIENCPAGTTAQGGVTQTQTLPRLSENSCAIRGDGSEWQIVDLQ